MSRPTPCPILSYAADGVALAARMRSEEASVRCEVCGGPIVGEPGGSGLLVWARGEAVRCDEPLLCSGCAVAIGVTAQRRWELEDEGEEG
jgi:hypothetical protein